MHKKNLMKLLPAVAVIAAVAVTGFPAEADEQKVNNVQTSETQIIKSAELEDLITTAYSYQGSSSESESADSKTKTSKKSKKTKKKINAIKTGAKKALPEKSAAAS